MLVALGLVQELDNQAPQVESSYLRRGSGGIGDKQIEKQWKTCIAKQRVTKEQMHNCTHKVGCRLGFGYPYPS